DDHVTIAPTQVEFGNGNAIPAIPADFFEPGSQPFVGAVPMTGGDAGTGGGGGGRVSVRLQRSADPVTPADPVGTSRTVPIEMVALSLTSVSPITVTDPAGVGTQWNLEVRVNRIEMSRLAPGTLTATKTHPNGGTFDAAFPLCADVLFTRVSDGVQRTLNLCSANGTVLDLSVSGSWVHNVDPALGLATPPGAAFNPGIEHEDIGVPQAVKPSTAQTPDIPPSVVHTVVPPPAFCPLPGNPFGLPDPCEQLQARDCQSTSTTDSCLPTLVRVVPGGAVAETCACITPGPGCGPIDIGPGGDTVSCPGQCFPPDVPGPCVVFTDDGTGPQSTGATSISVANLPVDTLLSCGCEQPPQPEACCLPDGTCAQLIPADCAAQRGKSLGAGSQCLGDQDGDGIDDACGSTPCAECGPGAHFIDQPPCPAGGSDQDTIDTGALVGIDLNGDCLADTSVVLGGISTIGKVGPLDDSAQFPGLRPVDNHTDVVDTEIIAMRLSGGGVSMIAGAGLGANALAASLGAVAEQPGNAAAADSFFDVFFEVSGGGLGGPAYNQTPINVATVIDCLPPKGRYIHIQGCTPIFDSPVPGVGTQVGNLVSARHFTFPECCLPDGTCTAMATKLC
ncbi:MAG: hypothetical protein ACE5E8_11485, partial [Acidimicrobiia bacterium]